MPRPAADEYNAFYSGYVSLAEGSEAEQVIAASVAPLEAWLSGLPEAKAQYAYAEGKWTLAQLMQHIIDTERVFAYRAMCIARGEQQALPGFDENLYATAAPASHRPLADLSAELLALRRLSVSLFNDIARCGQLNRTGIASGHPISVNALAFIMTGHIWHHRRIISERYLRD